METPLDKSPQTRTPVDGIPAWAGALLFAVAVLAFVYTRDLPAEAPDRGRLFALFLGLAGAGLLHFQRAVYPLTVMPATHRMAAFHFIWISAAAGAAGFVSPPLGMQVAMLGLLSAAAGLLLYPLRMVLKRQWTGAVLWLAFAALCADLYQQFFANSGENAWKTSLFHAPAAIGGFTAVLVAIAWWMGRAKK